MDNAHLAISLITLGDPDQLTGGYLYHRRMADAAAAHDAHIRFVSLPTRRFPLPALHARQALRQAQQRGSDLVVVDSIVAAFLGPALALRPPPLPLVAILHQPPGGIDHAWPRARLQAGLDRLAYRRAARLILASAALAADLPADLRDRAVVVAPGSDTGPPPSILLDLRRGRRLALLYVGNWVPRKGLLELLAAVAALPPQAVTLHLAGRDDIDPGYAARVRARLARPDLAGRVVVHGHLNRCQVNALYHSSDAFALPSIREPYGTAYGEAMAAGLPVVGWRAGNLPHLAQHGREALMAAPGDINGLTTALRRLADDELYRHRLAAAARQRATALPTWEQSADQLFTTLQAVARQGTNRGHSGPVLPSW